MRQRYGIMTQQKLGNNRQAGKQGVPVLDTIVASTTAEMAHSMLDDEEWGTTMSQQKLDSRRRVGRTAAALSTTSGTLPTTPAAEVSHSMIEDEEWGQPREFLAGMLLSPSWPVTMQQGRKRGKSEADQVVQRASLGPVYDWWRELLWQVEAECLTYLQSKPVRPATAAPPASGPSTSSINMLTFAAQNVQHIFNVFKR
jgi:hypothetical protein